MIRKILERLAYGEHQRKARDGEYRYMFCPHCGAFIPQHYHAPRDGMKMACPDCERQAHIRPLDDDPNLLIDDGSRLSDLSSQFADAVEDADPGSRIILDEPRREILTEDMDSWREEIGSGFIECNSCGAENSFRINHGDMVCTECGHKRDETE